MKTGAGVHADLIPGTFRPVANRTNGYLMDRAAQEAGHYYSGVKGLAIQDASVQESMGPIADRSKENLVSTDNAIIMARLRLRKAAQAVQEGKPRAWPRRGGAERALGLVRAAGGWRVQGRRARCRQGPQGRTARGGLTRCSQLDIAHHILRWRATKSPR